MNLTSCPDQRVTVQQNRQTCPEESDGSRREDAFAVGVGTVMDPLTDADWEGWLYHTLIDVHVQTATIGEEFQLPSVVD